MKTKIFTFFLILILAGCSKKELESTENLSADVQIKTKGNPIATVTWNIVGKYGAINFSTIKQAVTDAKDWFSDPDNQNKELILAFNKGSWAIVNPVTSEPAIDLSDIEPGANGRLVFQGAAAQGSNATTLRFTSLRQLQLEATNCKRVTFRTMHFAKDPGFALATRGSVVSVTPGKVVLDVPAGFPTPQQLNAPWIPIGTGRFMKRYIIPGAGGFPQLDLTQPDNGQPYKESSQDDPVNYPNRWTMHLINPGTMPYFNAGDLIGIKSKNSNSAYEFFNCTDILFDNLVWSGQARGLFYGNTEYVRIRNCKVLRLQPINGIQFCNSTSAGGPQIGNEHTGEIVKHVVVENCNFLSLGDDAIALFKVEDARISGNYITDAWARGININQSVNVCLQPVNTLIRCLELWQEGPNGEGDTESNCLNPEP